MFLIVRIILNEWNRIPAILRRIVVVIVMTIPVIWIMIIIRMIVIWWWMVVVIVIWRWWAVVVIIWVAVKIILCRWRMRIPRGWRVMVTMVTIIVVTPPTVYNICRSGVVPIWGSDRGIPGISGAGFWTWTVPLVVRALILSCWQRFNCWREKKKIKKFAKSSKTSWKKTK